MHKQISDKIKKWTKFFVVVYFVLSEFVCRLIDDLIVLNQIKFCYRSFW